MRREAGALRTAQARSSDKGRTSLDKQAGRSGPAKWGIKLHASPTRAHGRPSPTTHALHPWTLPAARTQACAYGSPERPPLEVHRLMCPVSSSADSVMLPAADESGSHVGEEIDRRRWWSLETAVWRRRGWRSAVRG